MAGPMRAKQVQVRADGEGRGGDDGEKKQQANQRPAAGADAEFQIAQVKG
jgi:hypothetical protein